MESQSMPEDAYRRAGVDILAGNVAVERYREIASSWRHPQQIDGLGGFSGLFALPGDPSRALVANATPLFFLDYLAVGKLDPDVAAALVAGVHRACREHAAALLGGETAEMPGLYRREDFDLAGTIVGIVDVSAIPDPQRVAPGDAIIGLPSIGLHTNGYTLARALIPENEWDQPFGEATYADALLAPHPSYYEAVRAIEAVA